jgi:hypothetical protein
MIEHGNAYFLQLGVYQIFSKLNFQSAGYGSDSIYLNKMVAVSLISKKCNHFYTDAHEQT